MPNNYPEIEKILKKVPENVPYLLGSLTRAAFLHSEGYSAQEVLLSEYGEPGRALIVAPTFIENEDRSICGHMHLLYEVRVNALLTLKEAAKHCNVSYRTIQRWRDEHDMPVFEVDGQQRVPSEIARDFAEKQGSR